MAGIGPISFAGRCSPTSAPRRRGSNGPPAAALAWGASPVLDRGRDPPRGRPERAARGSSRGARVWSARVGGADRGLPPRGDGAARPRPRRVPGAQPGAGLRPDDRLGQSGRYAHTAGHDITYLAISGSAPHGRRGGRQAGAPGQPARRLRRRRCLPRLRRGQRAAARAGEPGSARWSTRRSSTAPPRSPGCSTASSRWAPGRTSAGSTCSTEARRSTTATSAPTAAGWRSGRSSRSSTRALLEKLGWPDDEAIAAHLDPATWPTIRERLTAKFAERPRDEWHELFADSDGCVAPVLSLREAREDGHNRDRGIFVKVGDMPQPARRRASASPSPTCDPRFGFALDRPRDRPATVPEPAVTPALRSSSAPGRPCPRTRARTSGRRSVCRIGARAMTRRVAIVTGAGRGIGAATVAALAAEGWSVVAVDRCAPDRRLPYAMATERDLDAVVAVAEERPARPTRHARRPGPRRRWRCGSRRGRRRGRRRGACLRHRGRRSLGRPRGLRRQRAARSPAASRPGNCPPTSSAPCSRSTSKRSCIAARLVVPSLLGRPRPRPAASSPSPPPAPARAMSGLAVYSAAKAGVEGFVRSLAADLHGSGVTANSVAPGSTDTPLLAESARLFELPSPRDFAPVSPWSACSSRARSPRRSPGS